MRMRKKRNLPLRLERCEAVHVRNPEDYRGRWLEKIPGYGQLHLEIGCGKGRFTANAALSEPGTLFVAIERVPEALVVAMERAVRDNIPNVRFITMDASRLAEAFAPGEVGRIYINFCDPWPRNTQRKRRLTHENYLRIYREILRPGGEIHFKTDSDKLFEFSLAEFQRCGFKVLEVARDLHRDGPSGIMTDYELKFYEQGVSISRCVARLEA